MLSSHPKKSAVLLIAWLHLDMPCSSCCAENDCCAVALRVFPITLLKMNIRWLNFVIYGQNMSGISLVPLNDLMKLMKTPSRLRIGFRENNNCYPTKIENRLMGEGQPMYFLLKYKKYNIKLSTINSRSTLLRRIQVVRIGQVDSSTLLGGPCLSASSCQPEMVRSSCRLGLTQ